MTVENTISLKEVRFGWHNNQTLLTIDKLTLSKGEQIFLQGPSGSGKSTLLNLLGGLISPQQGSIQLLNTDITTLSQAKRDRFRADHFGILFQQFNLLPYLSVLDNVLLPCRFSKLRQQRAIEPRESAIRLLTTLGLEAFIQQPIRTASLSIGQQQRVAAARALIGYPEIILADEPTSALDHDSRDQFLALLTQQCREMSSTLIFVSHDLSLSHQFDRCLNLSEFNQTGL